MSVVPPSATQAASSVLGSITSVAINTTKLIDGLGMGAEKFQKYMQRSLEEQTIRDEGEMASFKLTVKEETAIKLYEHRTKIDNICKDEEKKTLFLKALADLETEMEKRKSKD